MTLFIICFCFFFFKQKTAYEMRISDWSSDVCSSDLLREKLDFADAAAPALEVVAGTEGLALREMVADAVAHRADFLKLTEIEAAAPDERLDRRQKFAAEVAVAGGGARADECRLFPRQRLRFIIGEIGRAHV